MPVDMRTQILKMHAMRCSLINTWLPSPTFSKTVEQELWSWMNVGSKLLFLLLIMV